MDPRDRSDSLDEGQAFKRQKVNVDTFPWVQHKRILGMHTISNNNREIKVIGGIQFKYGAAEAAKKVKNAGDWLQAFCVYMKAVAFVFPHRKEELEDYTEQVASLFTVVTEANHPIIINYDKAVRTGVEGVQNLLLTDKSEFEDL